MKNVSVGRPTHALVVDDDFMIRMDAASILEETGFATFEASHADAAIALLNEHHPDISLLFTDVQMPGTRDGFALARYTAAHWPHICIVVASGHAQPRHGDLPEGAHFVAKPFSAAVVRQHVAAAMPEQHKSDALKNDGP